MPTLRTSRERRPALRLALCCAVVATFVACPGVDRSRSALRVTVVIKDGVKAKCVQVFAKPAGGEEQRGSVIPLTDRAELTVAVFASPKLQGEVEVGARGLLGEDCSAANLVLNEESDVVSATFKDGEVVPVTVALDRVPPSFDLDGDGWRASSAQGPDCHDDAANAFPEGVESADVEGACADLLDNDCDGRVDCAQPACDAQPCSDGAACTVGERCVASVCGGGGPETCAGSNNECHLAPGTCDETKGGCIFAARTNQPCANGGACREDGACIPPTAEANCADGVDEDLDGAIDCADPDCDAQPCDDGQVCTGDGVCVSGACSTGAPASCAQNTDECLLQMGTCAADGGCEFMAKMPGTPCSLGDCSALGVCNASESGNACGNGVDDDGDLLIDCDDGSCAGESCDALDLCTTGDSCTDPGVCGGGAADPCDTPGVCQTTPSACQPATGCSYSVDVDAACTGGFCDVTGACQPPFPYAPSNFKPLDHAPANRGGPYVINCGTVVYDSTAGATNPAWCGVPAPVAKVVKQTGSVDIVVLPVKGLEISAGANALSIVGTRPVVLAVYGDATIAGSLLAISDHENPEAGGSSSECSAAQMGGAGGSASGAGSGGGGGGFGTAGAAGGGTTAGGAIGIAGVATMGAETLSPLRGGCRAGAGGDTGGARGAGGGALQVSAAGTLTVTGVVAAPGGGGRGGAGSQRGGRGGGSGGAVLLEGNSVSFAASTVVSVTGGAGAEGGGMSSTGNPGGNGPTGGTTPAQGGAGGSSIGGNGGDGAFPPTAAQTGFTATGGGGGGGGGGLGLIRVNAGTACSGSGMASFLGVVTSSGTGCP